MWERIKNLGSWIWAGLAAIGAALLWWRVRRSSVIRDEDRKTVEDAKIAVAVADTEIAMLSKDKAANAKRIEEIREQRAAVQRRVVAEVRGVEVMDADDLEHEFNSLY